MTNEIQESKQELPKSVAPQTTRTELRTSSSPTPSPPRYAAKNRPNQGGYENAVTRTTRQTNKGEMLHAQVQAEWNVNPSGRNEVPIDSACSVLTWSNVKSSATGADSARQKCNRDNRTFHVQVRKR